MSRLRDPHILVGKAYCFHGDPELSIAEQHEAPVECAKALGKGKLTFRVQEQLRQISGFGVGQKTLDGDLPSFDAFLAGVGRAPIVATTIVVTTERVPGGVPVELGIFRKTARERIWLVSFGPLLEIRQWQRILNLAPLSSVQQGMARFVPAIRAREVRKQIWDQAKELRR